MISVAVVSLGRIGDAAQFAQLSVAVKRNSTLCGVTSGALPGWLLQGLIATNACLTLVLHCV